MQNQNYILFMYVFFGFDLQFQIYLLSKAPDTVGRLLSPMKFSK